MRYKPYIYPPIHGILDRSGQSLASEMKSEVLDIPPVSLQDHRGDAAVRRFLLAIRILSKISAKGSFRVLGLALILLPHSGRRDQLDGCPRGKKEIRPNGSTGFTDV